MEIAFLVAMLLGLAHVVVLNFDKVPEGYLKLLAKPRELKAEIRSKRQLREIEQIKLETNTMVNKHQDDLKVLRESRQKELDHFDYQLFSIERDHVMGSLSERAYALSQGSVGDKELLSLEKDIMDFYTGFRKMTEHDIYVDHRLVEDMNVLVNLADNVKEARYRVDERNRKAKAKLKEIEAEKKALAQRERLALERGNVPHLAEPAHILNYIASMKDPECSYKEQLAAIKRFLGADWDDIAFYYDDEASMNRMMEKMDAKLKRSYAAEGFDEKMQEEMLKRYNEAPDKQAFREFWGIE